MNSDSSPALPPLPQPGTEIHPSDPLPQPRAFLFGLDLESQGLWKKDCKEEASHLSLHPPPAPRPPIAVSQEVAPQKDGRAGNSNPLSAVRAGTHTPHPPKETAERSRAQQVAARITGT